MDNVRVTAFILPPVCQKHSVLSKAPPLSPIWSRKWEETHVVHMSTLMPSTFRVAPQQVGYYFQWSSLSLCNLFL